MYSNINIKILGLKNVNAYAFIFEEVIKVLCLRKLGPIQALYREYFTPQVIELGDLLKACSGLILNETIFFQKKIEILHLD